VEEGRVAAVVVGAVRVRARAVWVDPKPPGRVASASAPIADTRYRIRPESPAMITSAPGAAQR